MRQARKNIPAPHHFGRIAQQIARQRIDVVEMRQRQLAETPRLFGIIVDNLDRHHRWPGARGILRPAGRKPLAGQGCDALVLSATQP
jgi:hypothetical protein